MISKKKQVILRFLDEVWSEGRVDCVDNYIADQFHIRHDPGDPWDGQVLDRDGFKQRLVKSRSVAPDQKFLPVQCVEDDCAVAVAWTWQGTHLGDLPNLPATGRPFTMSGLTVYGFDKGLITGHWQIADRLGVFQQLMQKRPV